MISRRRFTFLFTKTIALGSVLPIAELLNSCVYNKKDEQVNPKEEEKYKSLRLLSPNGGEHFDQVETIDVHWSSENISRVNILLSYDNGNSWIYLIKNIEAKKNSLKVDLPSGNIFSEECLLKVESIEEANFSERSDSNFSISKGILETSIHLLKPEVGELLVTKQNYQIKWSVVNVVVFNLQLYINNNLWKTIASNISGNAYEWEVSEVLSSNVKIRISDASNNGVADTSEQFQIVAEFNIDLTVHKELENIGGYKIFEDAMFGKFVVKKIAVDEYKTFSMYCTHNGCIIGLKADQSFACPCHGSTFNGEGEVTNGPAEEPLKNLRTQYFSSESKLVVYSY